MLEGEKVFVFFIEVRWLSNIKHTVEQVRRGASLYLAAGSLASAPDLHIDDGHEVHEPQNEEQDDAEQGDALQNQLQ